MQLLAIERLRAVRVIVWHLPLIYYHSLLRYSIGQYQVRKVNYITYTLTFY